MKNKGLLMTVVILAILGVVGFATWLVSKDKKDVKPLETSNSSTYKEAGEATKLSDLPPSAAEAAKRFMAWVKLRGDSSAKEYYDNIAAQAKSRNVSFKKQLESNVVWLYNEGRLEVQ